MTDEPIFLTEVFQKVIIPILTLLGGWFGHLWRTKQKKEKDILDNVMQIMKIQKDYIADQDSENKKTRDINMRLERKLNEKRESIRKANYCKYTATDEGCPVLNHEDYLDEKCKDCDWKNNADCKA